MNRRYTFKLYPTPEQAEELRRQCGLVGELWNALLHMQEDRYRRTRGQRGVTHDPAAKPHMSNFDMGYHVSELRNRCPEWRDLSTWTPRRVCAALDRAFAAFFRRAKAGAGAQSGYPRYKSARRGQHNWLPHRCASGCSLTHVAGKNWTLALKGVPAAIHARGELPGDPSKYTDADIREIDGVWWLSIAGVFGRQRSAGDKATEVKLGQLDCFARLDGRMVLAGSLGLIKPGEDDQIEQLQRKMSELTKGSDAWHHTRRRKARIQGRQRRRRREKLHEWTTALVAGASEIILITPESVRVATKSGRGDEKSWGAAVDFKAEINRIVLDHAPAMAADMIRYKAGEAGISVRECTHSDLQVGDLVVANRKAERAVKRAIKKRNAA
jgi:putative transposase